MTRGRRDSIRLWLAMFLAAGPLIGSVAAQPSDRDAVRIGMVSTLFRDVPEPLIMAMMRPFGTLMRSQTGISGSMVQGGDAKHLAHLLAHNKVQLAVFHGVEFAWARQEHPELRPLMIAINQQRHLQAFLVVRTDAPFQHGADLKDKSLAVPRPCREHCHLFLQKVCHDCGGTPEQYFTTIASSPNAEEALDQVVDRTVSAALVDGVSLECYRRRKPGRASRVHVIERSEIFPAAVVAYLPGALDDDTLEQFRSGLMNANQTALGRQFLTLWKLTAFEPVPDDYEDTLVTILKSYPTDTSLKK